MIYSVVIQKGGVGKTTTTAALAQAAAYIGKKVLAVDMDPQANCSYALAADATRPGAYEMIHGTPAADVIQHSPQGLDVISASPKLQTEASARGSARRLQEAIDPIKHQYDCIFIDTPSTAGEMQYNALQAAEGVIIPTQADAYNLQSIYQTLNTAQQFMRSNPALTISGVIFTSYDNRPKVNRQMREIITGKCEAAGAPILGTVRKSCTIAEAAALQLSLYEYARRSNPAADYINILATLLHEAI